MSAWPEGPNTIDEWPVWRLVVEPGISSGLAEIDSAWSLYDVLDANEALDVFGDANDYAHGLAFPPGTRQAEGHDTTSAPLALSFGGGR